MLTTPEKFTSLFMLFIDFVNLCFYDGSLLFDFGVSISDSFNYSNTCRSRALSFSF